MGNLFTSESNIELIIIIWLFKDGEEIKVNNLKRNSNK